MSEAGPFHYIGKPLLRKEDHRLLTGHGRLHPALLVTTLPR